MVLFLRKLLRLCRPYRERLILGVVAGLIGGALEALLMLSVKVAIDVTFPGANTLSANLPTFSANSIISLPAFARQFQPPTTPVSQYLITNFSSATRQRIADYTDPKSPPPLLAESFAHELNGQLLDPKLYNPQLFPDSILSPNARLFFAQKPTAANLARRNRLLLESAYPKDLAVADLPFLDRHPALADKVARFTQWLPDGRSSGKVGVMLVILTIPLMMLLRGAVSYLNVYFLQWVAVRAITDLRTKLFAHLMNLPLGFMNKVSTGELISRVMGDTNAVQNAISNSLVVIIKDPATLIGLIILLLCQQPMLTLVSLIVFPVCLVPIIIYARKVRHSSRAIQTQFAELSRIMHESFTGNRIIKAYNLERNVVTQFRDASNRFIGHFMRSVRAGEMPGPLIEFFGAIGIAALFYYILVLSHQRPDVGAFVMFVGSVFSMYKPAKSLSRLYNQLEQANASSQRVFELLDTVSTLPEPQKPVALKAAGAEIQFDALNFNYEAKPVLQDFSLTVKPGQMIALVGPSGSGKTTITNLLLRFYDPITGSVRIGGVDIRNVTTGDLRSQIAVVTQETLLFDETIRRNIEMGRPGATDEEIIAAAKHAHAHDFIMEKPGGYNSIVGEKGVTLSGGQKQRLAIARAILKNAPILILDEATSALDTQAERIVQAALEELMVGRTTFCIAHRLSTIQNADLIVVLEQGRIVETGRHDELLSRDGTYRRLYELQFQS